MRLAIPLCLVVLSLGAFGAETVSLRGQWQVTIPTDPTFSGVVLVDAERRVTWDAVWDGRGRSNATGRARARGYVRRTDGSTAEIILTDGAQVNNARCTIQSNDLLHCYAFFPNGQTDGILMILARVGRGPTTLMPVPLSRLN